MTGDLTTDDVHRIITLRIAKIDSTVDRLVSKELMGVKFEGLNNELAEKFQGLNKELGTLRDMVQYTNKRIDRFQIYFIGILLTVVGHLAWALWSSKG